MSVASPCINVCRMDPDSGLCDGCFRTLDEIALWARIDDVRRTAILALVARRRQERGAPADTLRCDGDRDG
jgi:predicted Fe-S protein YdhL (DUF1289 family)